MVTGQDRQSGRVYMSTVQMLKLILRWLRGAPSALSLRSCVTLAPRVQPRRAHETRAWPENMFLRNSQRLGWFTFTTSLVSACTQCSHNLSLFSPWNELDVDRDASAGASCVFHISPVAASASCVHNACDSAGVTPGVCRTTMSGSLLWSTTPCIYVGHAHMQSVPWLLIQYRDTTPAVAHSRLCLQV